MLTFPRNLVTLCLVSLISTSAVGSSSNIYAQRPPAPTVSLKKETITKDELYFGMSRPGGEIVSEAQWQQFLNSKITPNFREGLTVLDGYGQYLDSDGILSREKTKVVILIYAPSPEKNQAISEIINSYKQQFQQESVLHVSSLVQVSF